MDGKAARAAVTEPRGGVINSEAMKPQKQREFSDSISGSLVLKFKLLPFATRS
jgi:hypothetical protein